MYKTFGSSNSFFATPAGIETTTLDFPFTIASKSLNSFKHPIALTLVFAASNLVAMAFRFSSVRQRRTFGAPASVLHVGQCRIVAERGAPHTEQVSKKLMAGDTIVNCSFSY
jgi:hypothetical protein